MMMMMTKRARMVELNFALSSRCRRVIDNGDGNWMMKVDQTQIDIGVALILIFAHLQASTSSASESSSSSSSSFSSVIIVSALGSNVASKSVGCSRSSWGTTGGE
jgi:hypothetical protein